MRLAELSRETKRLQSKEGDRGYGRKVECIERGLPLSIKIFAGNIRALHHRHKRWGNS